MKSDRLKIFQADECLVLDMLRGLGHYEFVTLPVVPEIPPDAVLESVYHSPYRRCWELVVSHTSFEPVSPGATIPMADTTELFKRHTFVRKPINETHEPSGDAPASWRDKPSML